MQTTTACHLEGDDLTTLGNNSQPFIVSKEHTALAKTLSDLESKDGHQPTKQVGTSKKLVQNPNTRQRKFKTKASEEKKNKEEYYIFTK